MRYPLVGLLCLTCAACSTAAPPPQQYSPNVSPAYVTPPIDQVSIQTFRVTTPGTSVSCNGSYSRLPNTTSATAYAICEDGRTGTLQVATAFIGEPLSGSIKLSDGSEDYIEFASSGVPGTTALGIARNLQSPSGVAPTSQTVAAVYSPPSQASPSYSGNCPTPESLDSAGRRCGKRSAASRPGGYSGYEPTASYSGTTYVRGHYRNGRYVKGHTRRRR